MGIRKLFPGLILLCVVFAELSSVRADSIYRINTRAYRRMMATNTHAYRHMMYAQYPSQFRQDIRGLVTNHVLQPNGPFDQLIGRLLRVVAAADQENDIDDTLVAQQEPSPDPDIAATLGKTQEILRMLGLEEPAPPEPPVSTPAITGTKDFSQFEEPVN